MDDLFQSVDRRLLDFYRKLLLALASKSESADTRSAAKAILEEGLRLESEFTDEEIQDNHREQHGGSDVWSDSACPVCGCADPQYKI